MPIKRSLVIFIDISGAFDNLWWPKNFQDLHIRNIPSAIIKILKSYLTDRYIEYSSQYFTTSKLLTKGWPQGSVLGPFL